MRFLERTLFSQASSAIFEACHPESRFGVFPRDFRLNEALLPRQDHLQSIMAPVHNERNDELPPLRDPMEIPGTISLKLVD